MINDITQNISPVTALPGLLAPERPAAVNTLVEEELPLLSTELETLVGQINTFVTETNQTATDVENNKNSAAQSAILANGLANFQGVWNNATTYSKSQSVESTAGSKIYYTSKVDSNLNHAVTDTNYWLYIPINDKVDKAINSLTDKPTPIDADLVYLGDSASSFALKKLTWANLKATILSSFGAMISTLTAKTTPVDADIFIIGDSASSNASKQLTWANLKATIKAFTDTIYVTGGFVRQTVQSASVDSNGYANFITIGTGLAVNIAATTTNIKLNASGGVSDRNATITANTTIGSLTANTTNYLYADIASNGTVTLGSTTLAPIYQFGGTLSVTNNQHTFNISEMKMYVGNSSTASQVYRVFLGEAVTGASTVTSVVNYALNGQYDSGFFTVVSNTTYAKSHNIGVVDVKAEYQYKFATANAPFAVGDIVTMSVPIAYAGTGAMARQITNKNIVFRTYYTYGFINDGGTGQLMSDGSYKITFKRGW